MSQNTVTPLFGSCNEKVEVRPIMTNDFSDTNSNAIGFGYNSNVLFPHRRVWPSAPQAYRQTQCKSPECLYNVGQMPFYSNDFTYINKIDAAPMALKYNSCGSVSYNYINPQKPIYYGECSCVDGIVAINHCAAGYIPICSKRGAMDQATCAKVSNGNICDFGIRFDGGQWSSGLFN